jgi:hypothetical protein
MSSDMKQYRILDCRDAGETTKYVIEVWNKACMWWEYVDESRCWDDIPILMKEQIKNDEGGVMWEGTLDSFMHTPPDP